jgi:polyhydroxybutyrate depolymerase
MERADWPSRDLNFFIVLALIVAAILGACQWFEMREPVLEGSTPPPGVTAGTRVEELTSGGQARRYRLHVSTKYKAGTRTPLILNLHGYNSFGEQEEIISQMSVKADVAGFIVVYPEGLGNPQSWKFGDRAEGAADVAFIADLIRRLQSQYTIDANRIYATGISNGAEMSYRLACDMAETIAAFGFVSGGYPPFKDCNPPRAVPVVLFHGTKDQLLAYEGHPPLMLPVREWAANWAARNGCEAKPKVTYQKGEATGETWGNCRENSDVTLYTIEGKGHSWPGSTMPAFITTKDVNATDVMWEFFAAHPK